MNCDKIFCTNWPDHHFSGYHYCTFIYNADSMGNLFLRVTAGPSPNMDWTVGVDFFRKEDWVPPPPVVPSSRMKCKEPSAGSGQQYPRVKVLMQIVRTVFEQKVQTRQQNAYLLRFCPDRTTTDK